MVGDDKVLSALSHGQGINLKEKYDEIYHSREVWLRKTFAGKHSLIASLVRKEAKSGRLLDLGCGGGRLCLMCSSFAAEVWGVDYAEAAVAVASQLAKAAGRQNIRFEVAAFESGGLRSDHPFDVVVIAGTLEHVDNPLNTFALAHSLLKPDGLLVLECPNFSNFRGFIYGTLLTGLGLPMSLADIRQIRPDDVRQWADASGFVVEDLIGFLFNLGWSQRAVFDLTKRIPAALRDMGDTGPRMDLAKLEHWMRSQMSSNDRIFDYLKAQGVLQRIPASAPIDLQRPEGIEQEMWELMLAYLDDNFENDPYYCNVAPFNEWGAGSIYLLRKVNGTVDSVHKNYLP